MPFAYAIEDSKAMLWAIFISVLSMRNAVRNAKKASPSMLVPIRWATGTYTPVPSLTEKEHPTICARGIESRLVLLAVRIVGSSLKVERDNMAAADVIVYPVHRGHTFIFCIHA